jgi:hypothetical protein
VPLPETLRVKLSSEAAEAISITPVVVQEMSLREVLNHMLGLTGKEENRIRELLLRGTMVSGGSRFRWEGFDAPIDDLRRLLSTFPSPEPGRAFAREQCVRVILRGGPSAVEIVREAAARKPLLKRSSFWDLLMQLAGDGLEYRTYSYAERADIYHMPLTEESVSLLRQRASLLRYSGLRIQVRRTAFDRIEYVVVR